MCKIVVFAVYHMIHIQLWLHNMFIISLFFISWTKSGAVHIPDSSVFGTTSSPVFLSELVCSDNAHSLLYDCAHFQLGLATCNENFGYAAAKCFGTYIHTSVRKFVLFCIRKHMPWQQIQTLYMHMVMYVTWNNWFMARIYT